MPPDTEAVAEQVFTALADPTRRRSVPMRVAQQFLAALARDWDTPLAALKDHLDQPDRETATALDTTQRRDHR